MKIFVGLGNPGKKYKNTRHNVGFRVVDTIIQNTKYKTQNTKLGKKFNGEITESVINNEKILLAKPQTFMNLSGQAVNSIISFYKINLEDFFIIHDDVDLSLGTVKISFGEGSAGHNGVQSIISAISSQKFWRVRVGILSKSKDKIDTEKFVLEKFSKSESDLMNKIIEKIVLEIKNILEKGIEAKKFSINQRTDNEDKKN